MRKLAYLADYVLTVGTYYLFPLFRKCNVCNQCDEPQVPDYNQLAEHLHHQHEGEGNRGKRKRRNVNQPGAEICIQFNVRFVETVSTKFVCDGTLWSAIFYKPR